MTRIFIRAIFYICIITVLCGCKILTSKNHFASEQISFVWDNIRLGKDLYITKADSFVLFSNRDFLIYRHPNYLENEHHVLDSTGESQSVTTRDSIFFKYFIYGRGEKLGFFYIPFDGMNIQSKMRVDSFLVKHAFRTSGLNDFSQYKNVLKEKRGSILTEIYEPYQPDPSKPDTITMIFDEKFKNLEYSFAPTVDSLRVSKLVKFVFKQRQVGTPGQDEFVREFTQIFELKQHAVKDKDLLKIVEKYRHDSGNQ